MSQSSDSEFDELTDALKAFESESNDDGSEDEAPQESTSVIKRRKLEAPEDENELNKFLFGDKNSLIKNLEGKQSFYLDAATHEDDDNDDAANSLQQKNKKPLWQDSDDESYVEKRGEDAKNKQKRKHERIVGSKPKWADPDYKKEQSDVDSDEEAITQTVGFLDKKTSQAILPRGQINFKRMKNINRTTHKEGRITALEFHPKSTVGIVAGFRGVVSLFAIDGRENKKIHNMYYEKFYIHSCKLTNDGEEMIIGGELKDFHTYNLMTGYKQRTKLPRGVKHLKFFEISPCGKFMAVIGDYGDVHLLHTVTKELLCTMKQENPSTSLKFSIDSNEIYSHSDDNEVTIFDIRTHRIKHRFVDDGCVNGTTLAISSNGKFLAAGSRQGFVNIYNREDVCASKYPKPLKAFSNLTSEITDLKFNHTSELLAMCSIYGKNAIRLAHVQSATVYSNFPPNMEELGKTTVVNFSPESAYLGVGTLKCDAALYRLRHFNNY
jgi:U3 small nucleolar RNA-associated protein 18